MLKQELCQLLESKLNNLYNLQEINNIVNYFLRYAQHSTVPLRQDLASIQTTSWWEDWIEQLLVKKPIQYISGSAPFVHLDLLLNHKVLIPRPETEELAVMIDRDCRHENNLSVLDLGAGSGCIGFYLKSRHKDWRVVAIDNDPASIACMLDNMDHLQLNLEIIEMDFLKDSWDTLDKFNVVVSNPPYISKKEIPLMDESVLRYEPHAALFVPGDDPLIFYKKLMEFGKEHLHAGGRMYFEINEYHSQELYELCKQETIYDCEIVKDIQSKERFMVLIKHYNKTNL